MIAYIIYDKSSKEITTISHLPFDGSIGVDIDNELLVNVFSNPTVYIFNENSIIQKQDASEII